MNFRTELHVDSSAPLINHRSNIVVAGSCFAERISQWLAVHRFNVVSNPNGIIFHPMPLVRGLDRALHQREYTSNELVLNNGLFCSFDHHGSFALQDEHQTIEGMNKRLAQASQALRTADLLIVTWGSAWAYEMHDSGLPVANCHKFPGTHFRKTLTPIADIVKQWSIFLEALREVNPKIQCVLSVSPVRYLRDGMHGNQLSKAHLLLAAEELTNTFNYVSYFPAYEIMLDDLRDYRFYAEDMLHPSAQAVEYIISKFTDSYLAASTRSLIARMQPIVKFMSHRPMKVDEREWQMLLQQKEIELQELLKIVD